MNDILFVLKGISWQYLLNLLESLNSCVKIKIIAVHFIILCAMLWVFISLSVLYYLFLGYLIKFWNRKDILPAESKKGKNPFISVIVAVRNEEETIGCLIDGLVHQTYPAENFEVIVMDDSSTDDTLEIVQAKGRQLSCELKIGITGAEPPTGSGKKAALEEGIELAGGELILVTDGDCRVGKKWISTMAGRYSEGGADFLAGPVRLNDGNGFWQQLQVMEFASLTGTGGAFIHAGRPLFCNGANMAFRKEMFYKVNGYAGNKTWASGDDVFLMQKIHAAGGKVAFVKDRKAIVSTNPINRWKDFFHQRNRWAGKWYRNRDILSVLVPVFLFLYYLFMVVSLILVLAGLINGWVFLILIVIKWVLDFIFLKNVMNFLQNKWNIGIFVAGSMIYAFYALFFGVTANLTGFRWKDRKYGKR